MDTQKLLHCVLCYFLLSLLAGQQAVRGSLAPHHHHHHHHHHHSHRHTSKFRPSKLFVFGDSYADTGNTGKPWPSWKYPYGITFPGKPAGRFSDGRVLTDYISKFVGVRSPIPYRWRKYGFPLLKYGMNFAHGGTGVFQTLYPGPNMTTQIDIFQHLITDNVFTIRDLQSSVALVTLSGNDYAYIATSGGSARCTLLCTFSSTTGCFFDDLRRSIPNNYGIQSFIIKVVKQLAVNLKRIHGLGVKKVAVAALQPLGCLPGSTAMASFRQCNGTVNLLVNYHNLLLEKAVAKLNNETSDSPFLILDLYASFMFVFDNNGKIPGSKKFENPLKPCCFGISRDYKCGNVDESGAKKYTVCEDPKATFFWDGAHPTQEGWSAVYSALQPNLEHLY